MTMTKQRTSRRAGQSFLENIASLASQAVVAGLSESAARILVSTLRRVCLGVLRDWFSIWCPWIWWSSICLLTLPPAPPAVSLLLYCPGSVAMLADTLSAQRIYSRFLQMTLPASSGSPKPLDPYPPLAAGKAVPPRSFHAEEARAPENVLEPPVPALTAPRATAIVLRRRTDRPSSEYCRSCRAPNKDWVPSPKPPNKAQSPAHSRPFDHTDRRLPPSPPPTWRNPDSPGRAKRGLPRIDRRGCRLPPMPAAHSHTPDDPSPPTAPVQSRDHARRVGCTLSRGPPRHTGSPDTELARAPTAADRFPSTPAVKSMRPHNHRTARVPRTPALPAHSTPWGRAAAAAPLPPESQIRSTANTCSGRARNRRCQSFAN